MRYHYEQAVSYTLLKGQRYKCDHPVYNYCTLYLVGDKGLAVIQQRYIPNSKITWWGEIDKPLQDDLYFHPKFLEYFNKKGGEPINGLYPTVTVRQVMWALRMKPLKREPWETVFDKSPF